VSTQRRFFFAPFFGFSVLPVLSGTSGTYCCQFNRYCLPFYWEVCQGVGINALREEGVFVLSGLKTRIMENPSEYPGNSMNVFLCPADSSVVARVRRLSDS